MLKGSRVRKFVVDRSFDAELVQDGYLSFTAAWGNAGIQSDDILTITVTRADTYNAEFYDQASDSMTPCTCELVEGGPDYGDWAFMAPPPEVRVRDSECLVHGDSVAVKPGQAVADKFALIAQNYAGYLVGHPYHSARFGEPNTSTVDRTKPWREPNVLPDNCVFCEDMTDENVIQRVAGYQSQIDKEVIVRNTGKSWAYSKWVEARPSPRRTVAELRREFCETFQDGRVEGVDEWTEKSFPLTHLPMRLKRKMCIEWNHTYIDLMKNEDLYYDFSAKEFRRNAHLVAPDAQPSAQPRWVFPTA